MPIGDMSGAAANMIGVQRDRAAYNNAQKQNILSGIGAAGDMGASLVEAQHKAKMEQMLVAKGIDPATAKALIKAGPHATASALLQKERDETQRTQSLADTESARGFAREQGETLFGQQKELRGMPSYSDTQQDLQTAYTRDQQAQRAAALKEASADVEQPMGMGQPFPFRKPTGEEMALGMARKGFEYNPPSEMTPRAAPLSPYDTRRQQLQADQEMGAGDFKPTAPSEPKGDDQVVPAHITAILEEKAKVPKGSLANLTHRQWKLLESNPQEEMLRQLRIIAAQRDLGERLPKDEETVLLSRMSIEDANEYNRLKAIAGDQRNLMGQRVAPKPEAVTALNEFAASMRAKYGGGTPAPTNVTPSPGMGGNADAALKAEFEEIETTDPQRAYELLQKMTPEERARVGR